MLHQSNINFDDIAEELGELGRYQIFIYILICLPVLFGAANSLSYVFTAGIPEYRCLIPECETAESAIYDAPWAKWAIPHGSSDNQVIGVKSDICSRYQPKENASNCSPDSYTNTIIHCSEWVFSTVERTIVNDWNLTCIENQWKVSLVGSSHFTGIIVGSFVSGVLADRYGRKGVFVCCIFLMTAAGVLQILSSDYWIFVFLIFLNSVGTAGVYPLAFIIGVEMVGKNKREVTGIVLNYFYAIGEAIIAPIAYYIRDWTHLQLIVSAPAIIFMVYYWIIPESVRWLLAKRRMEKAKQIILKVAKYNKVTLSENTMECLKQSITLTEGNEPDKSTKIYPVVKDMLLSKKMIIRFLIVYFIWVVNAFIFYGLSINSTSLGGNKYINFALVSLVEIPGYTIAWVSIKKLGRRISLVGSLLLCGVTCTLTIFVQSTNFEWAVILLFLTGKFGITAAFGISYVYTAEMLPTVIRSGGVGSASTVSRFGALLAPFVPLLGLYFDPLPMIVFGVAGITAGLMALKLPETFGLKLPETSEEAKLL
ncbi:organic cation transporter protein isoform X2 [Diorhabda carinulata]|nr:organic cation transporter protein isoform X2 [Diorhabda carinulata]XP_057656534.1 organic cation transporter protein isoform X2 [Diorhabda carinulata]XP_057656535.1 organic cation transporter protein isoform X2 [Diorhabda carinulata]